MLWRPALTLQAEACAGQQAPEAAALPSPAAPGRCREAEQALTRLRVEILAVLGLAPAPARIAVQLSEPAQMKAPWPPRQAAPWSTVALPATFPLATLSAAMWLRERARAASLVERESAAAWSARLRRSPGTSAKLLMNR